MFGWIGTGIHAISTAVGNLFTGKNKAKRQAIKEAKGEVQQAQQEVKALKKQIEAQTLQAKATQAKGQVLFGKVTNFLKSYWYVFAGLLILYFTRDYWMPKKKSR